MDPQFSPFTTPQSPALLMPPPSLPPPSLPPPLTNERPNETPPHHSGGSHHFAQQLGNEMKATSSAHHNSLHSNQNNPLSMQQQQQTPSLSLTGSILSLNSFNPLSAQPPTPSVAPDSTLHPTLQ